MQTFDELNLLRPRPGTVIGRHSVWLPDQQIKVPFQFGGRVQKFRHPLEKSYPHLLVYREYEFLSWLSQRKWAPPVKRWVYFKSVISDHPGGWWHDPCGAYGYEMADANTLPPGKFTFEQLRDCGLVEGTPGAWNDLNKPGNVVNGYLVDVSRSGFDRLRLKHPMLTEAPWKIYEDPTLLQDVRTDGQFPFRERESPYQEVYHRGHWLRGDREVRVRAGLLEFAPAPGEVVLDIGCQLGGFLQLAALNHATCIGIDVQPEYIDLARRLARASGLNICFRELDASHYVQVGELLEWLAALLKPVEKTRVDHLLMLSMVKHFAGGVHTLWDVVDRLNARTTYLESNAAKEGQYPLRAGTEIRGGIYLGDSTDRNPRRLYRVPGSGSEPQPLRVS